MTAAVLIMSNRSIAIAADSRGLIGHGDTAKIGDTICKIYRISETQPISLLIDGAITFMGTPWETVVTAYLNDRGGIPKDTIEEWAKDFADFLQSFPVAADSSNENIRKIVTDAVMSATEFLRMGVEKSDDWSPSEHFVELALSVLEGRSQELAQTERLYEGISEKEIQLKYNVLITKSVRDAIGSWANADILNAAYQLGRNAVLSHAMLTNFTQLIFSGFCNGNIVPSATVCICDGYVGDQLKFSLGADRIIPHDGKGVIIPFEEGDSIRSILHRYHSEFLRTTQSCVHEIIVDRLESMAEEVRWKERMFGDRLAEDAVPIADHVADAIEDIVKERSIEDWFMPLLERVSQFENGDLADFAGGLVEHAVFLNRFSEDDSKAGGPVDVAVMTPDSFNWIKHKKDLL